MIACVGGCDGAAIEQLGVVYLVSSILSHLVSSCLIHLISSCLIHTPEPVYLGTRTWMSVVLQSARIQWLAVVQEVTEQAFEHC